MPNNQLTPYVFSSLIQGMNAQHVVLSMSTGTYQALMNVNGTMGGAAGIVPQPTLHGIKIRYDSSLSLHEVLVEIQQPGSKLNVTIMLCI